MNQRRFLFNAHGMTLGGSITQPFKAEIEGQAATSLPIIGGFASSKAENFNLKDIISYRSAHTYVSGIRTEDGLHHTSTTCIVEGLNILHVITADAIIGRLSSKHGETGQPEITPLGSTFKNLRIAGQLVHVDLDHDRFAQHPTFEKLVAQCESQSKRGKTATKTKEAPKPRYQWGLPSDEIPEKLEKGMLVPPGVGWYRSNGMLHTSMVKAVRPAGPDSPSEESPYGYAFYVPHVGNVYLAEMYASAESKRLCMLRVELGSPVVGDAAVVEPVGNGSWM